MFTIIVERVCWKLYREGIFMNFTGKRCWCVQQLDMLICKWASQWRIHKSGEFSIQTELRSLYFFRLCHVHILVSVIIIIWSYKHASCVYYAPELSDFLKNLINKINVGLPRVLPITSAYLIILLILSLILSIWPSYDMWTYYFQSLKLHFLLIRKVLV